MNARLAEIDEGILKVSIINLPATLLVGFGILGKYGKPEEIASFPIPLDEPLATGMIIIGAPIMVWAGVAVFRLMKEKARIKRGNV